MTLEYNTKSVLTVWEPKKIESQRRVHMWTSLEGLYSYMSVLDTVHWLNVHFQIDLKFLLRTSVLLYMKLLYAVQTVKIWNDLYWGYSLSFFLLNHFRKKKHFHWVIYPYFNQFYILHYTFQSVLTALVLKLVMF